MTKTDENAKVAHRKGLKFPILLGVMLAGLGAGGGYYAVSSGILANHSGQNAAEVDTVVKMPDISFVPVDPIIVSMRQGLENRHLQFRAQLEVPAKYDSEVASLLPRIVDVLNGYLRALEPGDLEDSSALTRLRSQMLRRVQIVVGQGRVNDLLIMEFVVN